MNNKFSFKKKLFFSENNLPTFIRIGKNIMDHNEGNEIVTDNNQSCI